MDMEIVQEVPGLFRVISLKVLRRTPGVLFDLVPREALGAIDSIDRVIHEGGACSPAPVGEVPRPWYMHPHQADNLLVLHGIRNVDLYTHQHGRIESFTVTPERIEHWGCVISEGPAMLVWPENVFHRVRSDASTGSASVNFARHLPGWDVKTNFNVYDLVAATGYYKVIREGHLDQPGP